MTHKQKEALQNEIDKHYKLIDEYFSEKYKKATTLERIKIRGVQTAINTIVESELLLEQECNQ